MVNSYAENREDDTKNALAIDGINPAYRPRKPLAFNKSRTTTETGGETSLKRCFPWIFAFTQSRGNDMNQPIAPLRPPEIGTATEGGRADVKNDFEFS